MITRKLHGSFLRFLLPGLLALGLGSCGASISGRLERGGGGDFTVSAALAPGAAGKLRDFLRLAQGNSGGGALLDASAIALSLSRAPGTASASFRNTGPVSLEGSVKIASLEEFLAPSDGAGFISFQESSAGGGRISIVLNRQTAPAALAFISPDIIYNLMFLFAPIATGDELSKEEYLTQVTLVHGAATAAEIAEARILVSVEFPGPLVSVRGGIFSGRKAEFAVPLVELLVLEQPLSYEAVWK
jgi:hypothetical protein